MFDKTPLHFGFHIGLNWYDFNMNLADLSEQADMFGVTSEALPGYNINIVANLRLTEHID